MPVIASKLAAAGVHLLTASGAAWAILAIDAIAGGRYPAALRWMLLALAIDGIDGALARRFAVRKTLPRIDGALLDNLVDYLNYAVVPAWFVVRAPLAPDPLAWPCAVAIVLASAYQFSQRDAKSADHFFIGFPSYWNVLVFYLLILDLPPLAGATLIGLFVVLTFVPFPYVYPSRTPTLGGLTWTLTAAWMALLAGLIWIWPERPVGWAVASLAYPVYYVALSARLATRRGG